MSDTSGFQASDDQSDYYQTSVNPFMAPLSEALVAGSVRTGDRVLDVACGTGIATRAAANAAGPGGNVVGLDINPGMLATARTVTDTDAPISWVEASALEIPFDDDSFDTAISQQGIQFFPDVAAGLMEMARVVRPGGRVGATMWTTIEHTPFLAAETAMLVRHCGLDPEISEQAFPMDGDIKLAAWFDSVGIDDVAIEVLEPIVSLPPLSSYLPEHLNALPWAAAFAGLDAITKAQAIEEVLEDLAVYATDTGTELPFSSYLATGVVR
jgi:SAM-dependent methyltransferase